MRVLRSGAAETLALPRSRSCRVRSHRLLRALRHIALLYSVLNAGFLAVYQVLVYAGSIDVLIVFAIMLVIAIFNQNFLKSFFVQFQV